MASVIDGMLLAHQPAIARIEARPNKMLQQWLGSGTFEPRADPASKSLILERLDWNGLSEAMASDVDRLARAGRETLQVTTCVSDMPKASAWILIQTYYASFYFAQAIMRICGISPSYYAPGELNNLNRILDAYKVTAPFSLKGQLLIELDGSSRSVTISQGSGGASHEAAWYEFRRLIDRVTALAISSTFDAVQKIEILEDLERLKTALTGSPGREYKISTIRNNVQYRQDLGGWHPYPNPTKSAELKRKISSSLNVREHLSDFEVSSHTSTIRFLESCLSICHTGRRFLYSLEEIYGSGFLKNGFCKLDKQYANLADI